MKNFFKNFRSYSFWVSLAGAVIILLNALGKAFGFEVQNQIVEDVILSFASVLVVLGIVTKTENSDKVESQNEEKTDAENEKDDENLDDSDVNK